MLKFLKLKSTKKEIARDVKMMILAQRTQAVMKQRNHQPGNDYWNRYQAQVNALNDLIENINDKYKIN